MTLSQEESSNRRHSHSIKQADRKSCQPVFFFKFPGQTGDNQSFYIYSLYLINSVDSRDAVHRGLELIH